MSAPELFAVPLADFVQARNALAARLKEAGRTSEAAEIQRIRKPTPAVWSVNQLARRQPEKLRELVQAVEALRRAHFKEAGALAQATEHHRAALQDLVDRATSLLGTTGLRPSPDVVRRISNTLSGAVVDSAARAELLDGRLTEEREAPGFEALAGPGPARRTSPRPAGAKPASSTKPSNALRLAQADAQRQQRRASELERVAARQQRAAAAATSAAEHARQRLAELDRRATKQRRAAEQAASAARQARQDAERAAEKARAAY